MSWSWMNNTVDKLMQYQIDNLTYSRSLILLLTLQWSHKKPQRIPTAIKLLHPIDTRERIY